MAPVIAYLRLHHVSVFPYLDDWLLVSRSYDQAVVDADFTLSLLRDLGLRINPCNSQIAPSQVVPFIGSILDSTRAMAFLPQDRFTKIARLLRAFAPRSCVTAHTAQRLLGLMASTTSTVPYARLRMRPLQHWLLSQFNPFWDPQSTLLKVTPALSQLLSWWASPDNLFRGRPFLAPRPSVQVTTDASPTGWGAHCGPLRVHGLWTSPEATLHINQLEMLAILKALRSFEPSVSNKVVQVVTDNTTVMFYVNKQGGTHSPPLLHLTLTLWDWCTARNIFLIAVHISTDDNFLADSLSRRPYDNHEWTLNQSVFRDLCHRWATPDLDVFATPDNTKCPLFFTRAGVGRRSQGDAFLHTWENALLYVFPPLPLLTKTIAKLRQDSSHAIVIAPWWPRQPWFSTLRAMALDHWRLPLLPDLLTQSQGRILHPDLRTLHLTAWKISPP